MMAPAAVTLARVHQQNRGGRRVLGIDGRAEKTSALSDTLHVFNARWLKSINILVTREATVLLSVNNMFRGTIDAEKRQGACVPKARFSTFIGDAIIALPFYSKLHGSANCLTIYASKNDIVRETVITSGL